MDLRNHTPPSTEKFHCLRLSEAAYYLVLILLWFTNLPNVAIGVGMPSRSGILAFMSSFVEMAPILVVDAFFGREVSLSPAF